MNPSSIEIKINGTKRSVSAGQTIADLIEQSDFSPNVIAVELNFELIPRERHAQTPISGGDQLEIVSLVGGG